MGLGREVSTKEYRFFQDELTTGWLIANSDLCHIKVSRVFYSNLPQKSLLISQITKRSGMLPAQEVSLLE